MCHALIPKEEVQEAETNELINKIYDGSADKLFAALLSRKKLSVEEIEKLKKLLLIWNEVISMTLLEVSFSGAVFIIAVVIIRAIAINSLPKKTFLVLWEMVLLRLVIPFTIPSAFSIYTLINNTISTPTFLKQKQTMLLLLYHGNIL